jgi:hypothetical protein
MYLIIFLFLDKLFTPYHHLENSKKLLLSGNAIAKSCNCIAKFCKVLLACIKALIQPGNFSYNFLEKWIKYFFCFTASQLGKRCFFIAYGIIFNSKGIISIFAKYKKQKC